MKISERRGGGQLRELSSNMRSLEIEHCGMTFTITEGSPSQPTISIESKGSPMLILPMTTNQVRLTSKPKKEKPE